MNILVNGIGNIGTTLLNIILMYKNDLGINKIFALKNIPHLWNLQELKILQEKGIEICTNNDKFTNFKSIQNKINYVFDSTSNGFGLRNKQWYTELPNLIAASAQGSEKDFGISFMSDINNSQLKNQKFAHIVSCNTHSLASILTTFCGKNLHNLHKADFVIVRRSEDLGNHTRLVSANVVSRHLNPKLGTHHSIDLVDLFYTINKKIDISSSDITTPSQLMHSVRFNVILKDKITQIEIDKLIDENDFVSHTPKFDSNIVFEFGRKYGYLGRLYSHSIIVKNNILINENEIKGWAFVPQEGNTILSTIHAFLLQTNNKNTNSIMQKMKTELLRKEW